MIKQKPNRKVTVRGKQRVNIFQLEKDIRRQHGLQNRINAKQAQLNTNQIIRCKNKTCSVVSGIGHWANKP